MNITDEAWAQLRADASDIASIAAYSVMGRTGLAIEPRHDAPDTWDALRAAYGGALVDVALTGAGELPIYDGHTDRTIYTTPEANIMARFWHDMTHLTLNRDFTRSGETAVALHQYHDAVDIGVSLDIPFWRVAQAALLIYRDTVAQVDYVETFGVFPDDQEDYMRDIWDKGTTIALRRAARTKEGAAA